MAAAGETVVETDLTAATTNDGSATYAEEEIGDHSLETVTEGFNEMNLSAEILDSQAITNLIGQVRNTSKSISSIV